MAVSHKLQRKMGGRQVVKEPVGLGCKALTGKGVVCMYFQAIVSSIPELAPVKSALTIYL